MYASHPSLLQISLFVGASLVETIITGISFRSSDAFICSSTFIPSTFGILMSRRRMSRPEEERGRRRRPEGPARALLKIAAEKPEAVIEALTA